MCYTSMSYQLLLLLFVSININIQKVKSISFNGGDIFLQCDSNKDTYIDKIELDKCVNSDSLEFRNSDYTLNNLKSVLFKMDADKDGRISLNEYLEGSKFDDASDDEIIEVRNSDGSMKRMKKRLLFDSVEKNMKGMKMKDGKMMKDIEGTDSLKSIIKNNPQMGSFIKLGNYSLELLKTFGYVTEGALYQMKSLSDSNNKNVDNHIITFAGNFSV